MRKLMFAAVGLMSLGLGASAQAQYGHGYGHHGHHRGYPSHHVYRPYNSYGYGYRGGLGYGYVPPVVRSPVYRNPYLNYGYSPFGMGGGCYRNPYSALPW